MLNRKRLMILLVMAVLVGSIGYIVYVLNSQNVAPEESEASSWFSVEKIIVSTRNSEKAPHGNGNVYSPDVLYEDGTYHMWYAGQGTDGHDRIHYATSANGRSWSKKGIVLNIGPNGDHVNDPSVVKVDDTYYMYYTYEEAILDSEIHVATSTDGENWTEKGVVIPPGQKATSWDSCFLYAPSVIVENGVFKMWYVGRKDVTPAIAESRGKKDCPISDDSKQYVGYATSYDGLSWIKGRDNPVLTEDTGVVDVKKVGTEYIMLVESRSGILASSSSDGISWITPKLFMPITQASFDKYGYITPSMFVQNANVSKIFTGTAAGTNWDKNRIALLDFKSTDFEEALNQTFVCTIQGLVYDENGTQCQNSFCDGYTIHLDDQFFSHDNPYFFYNVSAGSHVLELKPKNESGVQYSVCTNCTDHPPSSYINRARMQVECGGEGYIDIHWKVYQGDPPVVETSTVSPTTIIIHPPIEWQCEDADIDGSPGMSIVDLALFAKEYNRQCDGLCSLYDTNSDSTVDIQDLRELIRCFD